MPVAIALGGGAPNLTLMTGALWALDQCGIEPKVITTTGAGMVAGLLYAAPRRNPGESWKEARQRALQHTREMGIDDFIYDQFPVNYKIFQKSGRRAEAFARIVTPWIFSMPRETRRQRLLGDTLGFMAAMAQPWDLSLYSRGLCQPPPWIDIMVDFNELPKNIGENIKFRLSAYCIEDGAMHTFRDSEITADAFKAGLAMPFLYAPFTIPDPKTGKSKTYLEGSAFQTMELNPDGIMTKNRIKTIIIFDLMGHKNLIAAPKNLVDAWGKSIVAPLTRIATMQKEILQLKNVIYDTMWRDRKLIRNFDLSTRKIEWLIDRLADQSSQGDLSREELKELIQSTKTEIFKEIKERRKQRARYIEGEEAPDDNVPDESLINEYTNHLLNQEYVSNRRAERKKDEFLNYIYHNNDIDKRRENLCKLLNIKQDDVDEHILERFEKAERNWVRYKSNLATEYRTVVALGDDEIDQDYPDVLEMPFGWHVPEDQWPYVLDWSHSNMATLWDIGRDTAFKFVRDNYKQLGLEDAPAPAQTSLEHPHRGEKIEEQQGEPSPAHWTKVS